MDLERRGEHLDKEREGRKEEDEHFMRYEKKKEAIKKGLKGKGLKIAGDCERAMQCRNNEEMERKKNTNTVRIPSTERQKKEQGEKKYMVR